MAGTVTSDAIGDLAVTPRPKVIEVSDLTKRFGPFTAVDGIGFDVAEGEVFAFLGPNGAGKTTTINMLCTLARPTAGNVAIAGIDVAERPKAVRRHIGLVFQEQTLDDQLTAGENLRFHAVLYRVPREEVDERIARVLDLVDLSDRRHDLVSEFSGGMARRLEIARALLHVPRVLFLDEPTLGLDPQTRALMWEDVLRISIVWDREFGFLREMLVAPTSRASLAFGKTAGGATVATAQGTIMLVLAPLIGLRLTPLLVAEIIGLELLMAVALTSFGVFVASRIQKMEGFQVVMQLLLFPMIFLSGALFPLNGLPGWLQALTRLNPLTYAVAPLRQVVFSAQDMPAAARQRFPANVEGLGHTLSIATELAVVAVFAGVFLALAVRGFSRTG